MDEARFKDTERDLFDSKHELEKWLHDQHAGHVAVIWDVERQQLIAAFLWNGELVKVVDHPLPVRCGLKPHHKFYADTMARAAEQSRRQMGRRMLEHVKLIIDLAEEGHPEMLDAYKALPGGGPTFQQLGGMKGVVELLQNAQHLALPASTPEREEYEEVGDE